MYNIQTFLVNQIYSSKLSQDLQEACLVQKSIENQPIITNKKISRFAYNIKNYSLYLQV